MFGEAPMTGSCSAFADGTNEAKVDYNCSRPFIAATATAGVRYEGQRYAVEFRPRR